MMNRIRSLQLKKNWYKYLISLALVAVYLVPLYVLFSMALKPATEMTSYLTPPKGIYLGNFKTLLSPQSDMVRALMNTVIVTVSTLVLVILLGAAAAYPLSRNKTRLNGAVLNIIMGVMMIPHLCILVGVYRVLVSMNAISTYWGIVLVSVAFNLPMVIYPYKNFISTIPQSLDEASAIDGCSCLQTFFYIILPQLNM